MGLDLVSLVHVSLDSSKHKAMSYGRLKRREQQLCEEIKDLIAQANRCDEDEDQAYRERTGLRVAGGSARQEDAIEEDSGDEAGAGEARGRVEDGSSR